MPIIPIAGNQRTFSNWVENDPVIAIDLGFARENSTCGFAFSPPTLFPDIMDPCNRTFGQSHDHLSELLGRKTGDRKIALILEAPLSTAWNPEGNPCFRSPLEDGPPERPWYRQPAPVVLSAAVFLLRKILHNAVQPQHLELHVFEGYVTGKFFGRTHRRDAHNLVSAFRRKEDLIHANPNWESVLPLAIPNATTIAPHIIQIKEGQYKIL